MSKTKYLLLPPSRPRYIGSRDTTLAGSRNAFSAMVLWDYLAKHSYAKQIDKALRLDSLADYAFGKLKELEKKHGPLWVARSPMSLTIRFKCANPALVFKYSLATEKLLVDGEKRDYCHIYIMEHVTKELVDELVSDLSRSDSFAQRTTPRTETIGAVESYGMESFRPLVHIPQSGRGMG
jgi:histidine decarboxylase